MMNVAVGKVMGKVVVNPSEGIEHIYYYFWRITI
jgi:hypothetical protein